MADLSDDSDLRQKLPPLHIYLKRVLDKYPEGGQILKELVQNADDAEAKKVIFLFDKSEHSKDQLWTSELRQFQGPALYAYNDAVFKPPDWRNIQHPEQSGKADELTKVGRFGLGFISVYHLTDLPCILSGKKIGFLDPLEKYFNPQTSTRKRDKTWTLNAELLSQYRGQFSPFLLDLFHCAESSFVNGHFEGTIFRFPLRTAASELSKNVYKDDNRVIDLFRSFEKDSELSLLFLKHVESIEVYERGHINEEPRQLFKVHITPADRPHLTIQRQYFQDFLTRAQEMRDFHTVTCLNIEKQTGTGSCISRFITVNAIKTETLSVQLKQLFCDDDLKLIPWMGIAIQVGILGDSVGVSRSDGRVFCFLSMPCNQQTGLPVHVHGYFGLGNNRRGIKWPDRESRHDKNATWNKLLATEVFPDVYRKVVLAAIEKSKLSSDQVKPDDVYRAWPLKESITKEWSEGVKTFLQMLRNDAIFYTDHKGGCWMKANEVLVDDQRNPLLTKIVKRKGIPVAHLPDHVTASLRWAGVNYIEITPTVVLSCIRNDPLQYLSRAEKLQLIDYVTSDTLSDLTNIYLLPLQDGTFTMFSQRSPTVYIASSKNPSCLIPNAEAKFAASDMPAPVLKSSHVLLYTQLKNLEVDDIALLLKETLPSTWTRGTNVKVQWTPGCNKHPSIQWLTEMWNWLTKNQISLEKFRDIPLIPATNNTFLTKLHDSCIMYHTHQQSSHHLTKNVCSFLEDVGTIVLQNDLPVFITGHPSFNNHIHLPTPEGVLNVLTLRSQSVNIERCVANAVPCCKNELRRLFGKLRRVSSEQRKCLRLLPLFLTSDNSYIAGRQGVSAVSSNFFGIPVKRLKKCRIIIADSSDDNLVTLMGIHKESAVELLSNTILPAVAERFYNANESVTVMSWVLARSEYDDLVKTLKFIPTADGKLVSPSELFEPSDELVLLFESSNVFPVHPYSEGNLLSHLKWVGLMNDSHIKSSDVLYVAMKLSKSQEKGQADIERAKVLLNHINRFPHLLSLNVSSNRITKPLYKFLEDLNWVPCEGTAPFHYPISAGWYGNNNTLYSPRQVGLIETAMLQGSVVPLISVPGIRQELLNVFNWTAKIDPQKYQSVESVVFQLKNLASNFVYPAGIHAVSNAVHEIYRFLARASDQHLNHLFPQIVVSQPWIWHGAGFTTPDKMALTVGTLHIDLKPYLFTVPDSIKQHDNLLTRMGVQQTFQESALNFVLSHIQVKHAGEHVCNETSIKSDVELVHSILRYITTLPNFDSQTSDLLVPCRSLGTSDSCLRMMEASRCLYVDEVRLMNQNLGDNFTAEFDRRIIHMSISNDLAQRLGVQPLSHIAPSEAINYGYELAGPHETPINAIKCNLDMYKKGVDISKELTQNADNPCSQSKDDHVPPDRLVNPFTLVGSLFNEDDGRFPQGEEHRKDDDLPWDDVCERAESIRMNCGYDQKVKNLLRLMSDKLGRQDFPTSEQKERIQNAKFLPVLSKPPNYPSVWYKSDLELKSAASLYESRHKPLIGSVQPLLDEARLGTEAVNQNVKGFLGFVEKEVIVSDVINQLDILIKKTKRVKQKTTFMVHRIYSFLCRETVTDQSIERLCSLKFVLCEGEFRACQQFAFKYTGKSGPYLFQIPADLRQFETLFQHCGVKQQFDTNDYLLTLQRLKEEFKESPLSEVAVKTAETMTSEIVTIIHKDHEVSQGGITNNLELVDQKMVVLDDHCILRKPSELLHDDTRWVKKTVVGNYTHTSVTNHSAEIIGIKTTSHMNVENCSSSSGFESDFGQKEELTDRLSNILRSCPHVSDVFKELLQNADDAGATEIHFVYDPRKHKSEKVISAAWAEVQNLPALCVYNDKSFTEADIKGIQKVGVGGKREDIATTGRFGVGFNAVYHLTDCPSFLSNNDTLCVFDPLLKYTARADSSCPGRRYHTTEDFRQNFPDMLHGYLEDEIKHLEGTMFRFPLRAEPSEISKECFSPGRVKMLLDEFQTVSHEALLFLNNIKKITISCTNEVTNKLEEKYSTNATFSDEDNNFRAKLSEHVKLFKNNPHETIPPICHVYSLDMQDSHGNKEKWMVSQMVGFEEVVKGFRCSNNHLPKGGVAARMSRERFGMLHHQYRAYCVLPLPIYTKLPVHVNGMFELDTSRRNLSTDKEYKPMGSQTGDGKLIQNWNSQLINGVIAPAYAKLLVEARSVLLKESRGNLWSAYPFLLLYGDLFPTDLENVQGEWRLVAKATLRYISQKNLKVLPVARQNDNKMQITFHHVNTATSLAYFDDLSLKDAATFAVTAKQKTPRSTILRTFLLSVGFNLLKSSVKLCQAFQSCGVQAEFVSPQAVVRHLLCNPLIEPSSSVPLNRTAFQDIDTFSTILKYCLEGITQPIDLNGLPLRLTNDCKVGVFTTSDGLYVTSHWRVLPNLKHMFLHKKLAQLCFSWLHKNNTKDEAFTSGIFKKFTISECAVHLGNYLPEDWQGCTHHVKLTPEKNGHPRVSWLRNMWEYIYSEITLENAHTCLQPVQEWPLFPTTSGNLVSPEMSKTLLFFDGFSDSPFRQRITKVLKKLGVPEFSMEHMPPLPRSEFIGFLRKCLALPVNPEKVVDVIKFMLDTDIEIGILSLLESETLLEYLQEGCESFSDDNIQTIKRLRIFKLLNAEITSLQSSEEYHTIEDYSLLAVEAETWMQHVNCVFLQPSRQLSLVYGKLGISPITHADVYLKFILPSFNMLTLESRLSHLKIIEKNVLPNSSPGVQKAIMTKLSQISFIPDESGTLRTVEYFFDSENVVFKAMVDPNQLLPESMQLLKYFLIKLGLQNIVTQEMFVKFAKTIESKANEVTSSSQLENLFDNSQVLTRELQFNFRLSGATFLREISRIKFIPSVPVKQELIDIHPAVSDGLDLRPFIAYQGSMPEKYVELVWSVATLLPSWALPSNVINGGKMFMYDYLGISSEVVLDKALSHIQNVCGRMQEKNAIHKEDTLSPLVRDTLKKVMIKILKFLQDSKKEHGEKLKKRLHNTPLCLVDEGKVLIRADQLVFNMTSHQEKTLRPYLYKAPRELAVYDALLRFLGGQERCSFDQLAMMLSTIQRGCKNRRLAPNENTKVGVAVKSLFVLLSNTKETFKITVSELYLPNSNNLMRKSSNLYYADPHLMEQMKLVSIDKEFLIPLKQCGFDVNDEVSLIELLPESLRPKNLGNEMHENVHEDNEDCPAGQDCPYLEHIKRMVNSVEMTRVLLRLIQHQFGKPPDADTKQCVEQLQSFENFSCKSELKIGVFDPSGKMLASRPWSAAAFYDKTCIYLEHCWPHKGGLVFKQMADCCNNVIGQLLNSDHTSFLQAALLCQTPNDMNGVLSKSHIPEYNTTTRGMQPDEHAPGTIVPRDIRHLLDHDLFNRFDEEEIVAYERPLEDVCFPVDESLALGTGEFAPLESECASDEATEIVYALIIKQVGKTDESARLSMEYKIDVGLKEPIIVKVTALYKFLRPQEKPDPTVAPFTGDPTAEVPLTSDRCEPNVFENYEEQIKEQLNEAFNLPKKERKRAIKRLYVKWHPDKNLGHEDEANEAFKFLESEIDKHKKGSPYTQKYSKWDDDARRYREEAEQYQRRYYEHQPRGSSHFVPPSFSKETPDPRSARLWFRQAEEHIRVAELNKDLPTHVQWIAFQVHQAAEMALKAAQYSLDGRPDLRSNDLTYLARTVCQHRDVTSKEVLTLVSDLIRLGCDFSKPRQPQTQNSLTSGQAYQDFKISNALQLCRNLLDLVRDIIGIKVF